MPENSKYSRVYVEGMRRGGEMKGMRCKAHGHGKGLSDQGVMQAIYLTPEIDYQ